MRKILVRIGILVLVSVLFVTPVAAQNEACLALAESTFAALVEGCSEVGGGAACFGSAANANVEGFAETGDVLPLADINALSTAPLDLGAEEWGIAKLTVPANVPLSLSEEGVQYVLIGDAEVENAVASEAAFTPATPVSVTTIVGANLRSAPNAEAMVVNSAAVGTELSTDGLSADAGWLRVLTEAGDAAWISRQIVAADGDLDALPVVGDAARSLMQSFYLQTGTESSECSPQSPSMLVMQSPGAMGVDVTVNETDLNFDGTVVLRNLPDNAMQLFVLDGGASSGILSVPSGFTMTMPLAEDGRSPAGAWTDLRPMNGDERGFLGVLGLMPEGATHTAMSVPTAEQVSQMVAQFNQANTGSSQTMAGPAAGNVDCSLFQPTSPLDGLAFGQTTFYWDGAPGATSYRVNVYTDGQLATSADVDNVSTTTVIDTGTAFIGDGETYAWEAQALVNGEVACTSARVNLLRAAAAQRAGGGGGGDDDDGGGGGDSSCTWGC